jgi:3-hydroxyacyl-CoA dehydrogenase
MRLLEVVRGQATGSQVLATSMALAKKLGKVAVLSANRRGFIGNRTLAPYLREAELLVEEGASVEEVNQALYDFGMAMGPLAMQDLIGLDVWRLIRQELSIFEKPGARQPRLLDRLCELGRFGQKTGRGWSSYDEARRPSPDAETAALIDASSLQRRRIPPEEIVERCLAALVSECHEVLKEGVALRAGDIDVVYLLGFGFPAWRGGPMFYGARMMGLE